MRELLSSCRYLSRSATGLVAALLLTGLPFSHLYAQTPAASEKPLTHYVLIFHSSNSLTTEQLKQRAEGIQTWVKAVTDMGIVLDPRALGTTIVNLSAPKGEIISREESSDPTFGNLVFFDARSREDAIEVAKIHPGLRFGSQVELREWTTPRGAVANGR